MFGFKPGDPVLLLADVNQGIAILPGSALDGLLNAQRPASHANTDDARRKDRDV